MSSKLKPCPFCGGRAVIRTEYDMDGFGSFHRVECIDCSAGSTTHYVGNGNECPQFYQRVRASWQMRVASKEEDDG